MKKFTLLAVILIGFIIAFTMRQCGNNDMSDNNSYYSEGNSGYVYGTGDEGSSASNYFSSGNYGSSTGYSEDNSSSWSYGTASFRGKRPSNSRSIGGVTVWYNGSLNNTRSIGDTQYYEADGDICVAYPKGYSGKNLSFSSKNGSVQIQYQH